MSNQNNDFAESGDFRTCDAFKLQPQTPCLFDDAYGSFMKVGPVKMPTFETPDDVVGPVKMPTFEPSKDVIGPVKMPTFDGPEKGACEMPPFEPIHEAKHEGNEPSKWDQIKEQISQKLEDSRHPSDEEQKWVELWEAARKAGPVFPGQKVQQ